MQLIQSIIRVIDAIEENNFLPGLTIGLSVYDSCSQEELTQKSIISALVDAECTESFFFGILIQEGVEKYIKNLTMGLGVNTFVLTRNISDSLRASIIARAIHDLHWMPINKIISTNKNIGDEFLKSASSLGICVQQEVPLSEVSKVDSSDTIVLLSNYSTMRETVSSLSAARLVLAPVDDKYQPIKAFKSSKVFVIMQTSIERPLLLNPFNITERSSNDFASLTTKSHANLQLIQTTNDILTVVGNLKRLIKSHCQVGAKWNLCPNLPKFSYMSTVGEAIKSIEIIKSHLKFLRLDSDEFESFVLLEESLAIQRIGTIKLSGYNWILESEVNISDNISSCKQRPTNDSEGVDCSGCMNFNILYQDFFEQKLSLYSTVELKQEAWVAALLSISSVGVLCCVAIAVFIVVRICKKDMLEGNPGFSFLLLFSIILMYTSILPFSVEIINDNHYYKGIFCGLKIFGTSLSYSLVFSIMLARSFMLASCDEDGGFMSHVNGYLQTVLCFFIAAVQVALTMQFWAINWLLLSQQQCTAMSQGSLFLVLLGYDMFLLLLLLSISPFIIRSKRNYHEGGYFAFSTYICLGVWIAWCTGYTLLPHWEDVFVCCGLVATATVILVLIFIPRTYLMLTGIVRDHIVSTLPSLNHTSSTSIIDVNYRSTQALYDSVTIPRGNANPNYYADRPTTPSTSKMEDDRMDHPYERYERSPSPQNITRF